MFHLPITERAYIHVPQVATAAEFPSSGEGPSENAMALIPCKGNLVGGLATPREDGEQ